MEWQYLGRSVHYEDRGQGAPVLFLHGWGCDCSEFAGFFPVLEGRRRLIAPDLPGFGASEEPDEVWGVEDYTRFLEAFCDALGLENPAIVGHSFGCRIAIAFAARRKVERLVFTGAAGIKPRRSLSYYVKVWSYKTVKFLLLKVLRAQKLFERYRGQAGSADYRNASPRMKAILSRTVNEDLSALLPRIAAPTLLFWGTADTATPIADGRKMERLIPDAGLVQVPGGTHYAFLEAPALFSSVLESFFGVQ
ncbi:MAG: alpha/beta hydrolase [Bacteroidales bacterium]|nr:alpha/beta hydrolase [Bacteroidales bacterium]